jgi:hypothetical protein
MDSLATQCRHSSPAQFDLNLKVVALALTIIVFILALQTSAAELSSPYQGCRKKLENELKPGENCATIMSVNLSNKKQTGFKIAPFKDAVEALVYLVQKEEPDIVLLQEARQIHQYTSKKASPSAVDKFNNLFVGGPLKFIPYEQGSGNILLVNDSVFKAVGFARTKNEYLLSPGNIGRWAAARLQHKSEDNHQFVAISYHGYSNPVANSTSLCPPKNKDEISKGKCIKNFVSEVS